MSSTPSSSLDPAPQMAVPADHASPTERAVIERLERRIAREREARKEAERLLESKSRELYETNIALQTLTRELEERVAERTAEVQRLMDVERQHEEQLRHVQKMEALGLLAGGVAHDFNNLLTVIGGVSQILQVEPALDPFRELFDEILSASNRAAALTSQLLSFSRRRSTEPQAFGAAESIRDLQHLLRRLLTERIDLRLELQEGQQLFMDRGGFDQILLNLTANARDAMPDGGWFSVRTTRRQLTVGEAESLQLTAGDYAQIDAIDCGVGMDAEVVRRAFDPFFTTKPIGEGSGLGLANVYAIVRQAGGHVSIESTVGVGTTIRILLPQTTKLPPLTPPAPLRTGEQEAIQGTILVVDDEPGVRAVASRCLRKAGFCVLEAGSALQALEMARHATVPVDLLLSDVRMPGMNGFELAMALRQEFPRMGQILMSGYVDDDQLRERIVATKLSLIEKPFTPSALIEYVRQHLPDDRLPSLSSDP